MSLIQPSLDRTDKDFDSLRARARSLISAVFPDWTDDNVADFGNILVELFCFTGDVLGFYQDTQARETRWTQATQRKNILSLCKLIGFVPTGGTAAVASVVFTLPAALPGPVIIPAGFRIQTEEVTDPIAYQVVTATSIPAGGLTLTVPVENSETQTETFPSNATGNQSFRLARSPFVDGSAQVSAADGAYTKVSNFLSSTSIDRHFTVGEDQSQRGVITFGNGVNGSIPSGTVEVVYKTGGGKAGRVEQNKLKVLPVALSDTFGNSANATVTNPGPSSGGNDRQTNQSIQLLAPELARIGERSICREDFEIVARRVPGVARALCVGMAEDPAVQPNQGILLVVPTGGGVASPTLLGTIQSTIDTEFPSWESFDLQIISAPYVTANIILTAYRKSTTTAADMAANIRAALSVFFRISNDDDTPNTTIDFGYAFKVAGGDPSLAWSSIFNAARDAAGVAKLDPNAFLVNGTEADLPLGLREFPVLGTVTIVDGLTGVVIP